MRLRPYAVEETTARVAMTALGLGATGVIGLLHFATGLALEFHVFFLLPVVIVAWYVGPAPGTAVGAAAAGVWALMDWRLGGAPGSLGPLLFNSVMRLVVFLLVTALLEQLRKVLARETRLAREDSLTGLPNRRMFYAESARALAQAQRQEEPCTAIFLDLDRFKEVNDQHGHQAGDALLQEVAEVLRQGRRTSDVVGRLGGDEFALLLPGMTAEAAVAHAERLRDRLRERMSGRGWPVGVSIGVACFRFPPADVDAVVNRADALMYEAKRAGRDTIRHERYEGVPLADIRGAPSPR